MAGPHRATGHVVHANWSTGSLTTSTSTSTNVEILSSGTREWVVVENRGTGTFRITASTGSTEGLSMSTGAVLLFESVVPMNKLYAHPTSTKSLSVMVQEAL